MQDIHWLIRTGLLHVVHGYTFDVQTVKFVKYRILRIILSAIKDRGLYPTGFNLSIIGFGKLKESNSLILNSNSSFPLRFRSYQNPKFGLVSLSELQSNSQSLKYCSHRFDFRSRLKRFLSLAIQSRKFYFAIAHGSRCDVTIPIHDFTSVPYFTTTLGSEIWISRLASKSGIYNPELGPKLEFDFRRNVKKFSYYITKIDIRCVGTGWIRALTLFRLEKILDLIVEFNDIECAQIICNLYPKWHYVRSYFTIQFNQNIFGATNVYEISGTYQHTEGSSFEHSSRRANELIEKELDSDFKIVSLNGQIEILGQFFIVNDKILFPTDFGSTEVENIISWPNIYWGQEGSKFLAVPNFLENRRLPESRVIIGNSGWGHFIEEEIPRFLMLDSHSKEKCSIHAYSADNVQLEIVRDICNSPVELLDRKFKYTLNSCHTVLLKNFRNKSAKGERDFFADDTLSFLSYFNNHFQNSDTHLSQDQLIYIAREPGLFRYLKNGRDLDEFLLGLGFQKIVTTGLTLRERQNIFSRAKVIVSESGSGIFNSYFATRGCLLIEIRHPDLIQSNEMDLMLQVVGLRYEMFKAKKASFMRTANVLKDTYYVDIGKFKELILPLLLS